MSKGLFKLFFLLSLSVSHTAFATSITGKAEFIDSTGKVVQGYQRGDEVWLRVMDADANRSSEVERVKVLVTSATENQGSAASVSTVVAQRNVGNGSLQVVAVGERVKTENWEVLSVGNGAFIVTGSVSGAQSKQLVAGTAYQTADGQLDVQVTQGSVGFAVGDRFTFSTTAEQLTGEQLELQETEANSGVFTAKIMLNTSGMAIANNGVLDVTPGDRLTLDYRDAANDWGVEEVVRSRSLYATTLVSGRSFLGDVVWRPEDSPYLVTGDVTIGAQGSLTVLAGTQVLFLAGEDDQKSGDDPRRAELLVQGRLTIAGTAEAAVALSSVRRGAQAQRSDWGGVKLSGNSAQLDMGYAELSYSQYGLKWSQVYRGGAQRVHHSRLLENGQVFTASQCQGSSSDPCQFEISHNQIQGAELLFSVSSTDRLILHDNQGSDIDSLGWVSYVQQTRWERNQFNRVGGLDLQFIAQLEFTENHFTEVVTQPYGQAVRAYLVDFYSYGALDWQMKGNEFAALEQNPQAAGVRLTMDSAQIKQLVLNDNRISGFGGDGFQITSQFSNRVTVHNNQLLNNGRAGLRMSGRLLPDIRGNRIEGNAQGIYLEGNDTAAMVFAVSENEIINNRGAGMVLKGSVQPLINSNDIYGNQGYALENHTIYAIDARNNWWGETATKELATGGHPKALSFIYDGFSQSGYGKVNYAGFRAYSVWYVPEYTVTFVDWDQKVISTVKVKEGQAASAPAMPGRTGYTFTGWSALFDNVKADLTIVAQYRENDYLVTAKVEGGGGNVSPAQQLVKYSASVVFNLTPAQGYKIGRAEGCGGALKGNSYFVEDVKTDCSVTVSFQATRSRKRNMLLFIMAAKQAQQ